MAKSSRSPIASWPRVTSICKTWGRAWENWTRIATARGSTRTRFLPLSILLLTPFLALDHLRGLARSRLCSDSSTCRDTSSWASVSFSPAASWPDVSGRPSTAALSVLLLGLNWPVWMIARRMGPEPVLFALMTWFAVGGPRSRFVCLLLLPWVHASGLLLGLGGLLWLIVEERSISARGVRIACSRLGSWADRAWPCSGICRFTGTSILGGYNEYASDGFFALRNPLAGALALFLSIAWWTLPLWYVALLEGGHAAARGLALWLPALAFFGLFSHPEPARRLAPLLGAWVVVLMARPPAFPRLARRGTGPALAGFGRRWAWARILWTSCRRLSAFSAARFCCSSAWRLLRARPAQAAIAVLLLLIVIVSRAVRGPCDLVLNPCARL